MNALESPLEALALNYVTFGFSTLVNNLWTLIAVLTAAVSFWRMRVAGGGRFPKVEAPPPPMQEHQERPSIPMTPTPTPTPTPPNSVEEVALTRGSRKFAVYYRNDDDGSDVGESEEEGERGCKEAAAAEEEWFERWERAVRTRRGESEAAGWYLWQDMKELNGNVVRLWGEQHGGNCTTTSVVNKIWHHHDANCVLSWHFA